MPNALSRIVYEPLGVCGLIAPWNYPLLQISWKVAPALAAGDTMVVKPSQATPLTTIHLVRLLDEAGVPKGVVNLVLGPGNRVGQALAESLDVDLVSFTGSLAGGKSIMAAASVNVKRVALELGGKSPNIVFADADFETAVDNALTAAFLHSGQVCSAGCRLIVEDSIHDRFVDGAGAARGPHPAGPRHGRRHRNGGADLGRSPRTGRALHRTGHVRGRAAGYRRHAARPNRSSRTASTFARRCSPTAPPDMTIVREEVFGPVVTVERFTTEDEAIRLGNDTDYGLAGAVWTADASRAQRVAGRLRHGTVWINEYNRYLPQAEWGGFKQSGIGRELGPSGLDEYREAKHIYQNTAPAPTGWFSGD